MTPFMTVTVRNGERNRGFYVKLDNCENPSVEIGHMTFIKRPHGLRFFLCLSQPRSFFGTSAFLSFP